MATCEVMTLTTSVGSFLDAHATTVVAIATIVIAVFTCFLFVATRRIYKHSAVSERAYVKMSHLSGPEFGEGLAIDRDRKEARIVIKVRNSGQTPANVTNVDICWLVVPKGQAAPNIPNYPPPEKTDGTTTGFLVENDSFLVWKTFDGISGDHFDRIDTGDERLWIYGYVDYIDVFEQWHRGGYARQYDPGRADNNLIFVTQSGYNYDRPLRKRERNK